MYMIVLTSYLLNRVISVDASRTNYDLATGLSNVQTAGPGPGPTESSNQLDLLSTLQQENSALRLAFVCLHIDFNLSR